MQIVFKQERTLNLYTNVHANDIRAPTCVAGVGWHDSGWHFSEDAPLGGTLTCQYVFVLGECESAYGSRASSISFSGGNACVLKFVELPFSRFYEEVLITRPDEISPLSVTFMSSEIR